ncbi:DUF3152 domain-containing protein [Streptomyces sp. NPDC088730]|uniref:DUF3152 domain-containing protein n=1 Tax=Streptomyces sp. NPDC088730 TaxID=3365877 RepID=UPI003830519E
MGRHSRKSAGPQAPESASAPAEADSGREGTRPAPGNGRRRRPGEAPPATGGPAPFQGAPQVRGGHPEQREPGGGWGTGPIERPGPPRGGPGRTGVLPSAPPRPEAQGTGAKPLLPGPRKEFVEAFDAQPAQPAQSTQSAPPSRGPALEQDAPADPHSSAGERGKQPPGGEDGAPKDSRGGRGRTFTGIAAAAVTTVLAVIVAGQVAHDGGGRSGAAQAAGVDREGTDGASRSDGRKTPAPKAAVKPLTYQQKMAKPFPLAPKLKGSGKFEAVPGAAKAPGKGHRYVYRIDVEKGLGLDSALFAEAVQKTLNDERSWAHDGAMTFERISTGDPDFVITLASPGTTGVWCEKSGLDTTVDNVSCDSAATERVMINAYRWAQGSSTFGPDKLYPYRQMLINHEVGHRLGHNHVSCRTPGTLAPVMQQQTKSLDIDNIKCRPNAWVYPKG